MIPAYPITVQEDSHASGTLSTTIVMKENAGILEAYLQMPLTARITLQD
jgi:hypothetical protein